MSLTRGSEAVRQLVAPDLLRWRAENHPDRTAMSVAGESTLTFADWECKSNAVAGRLLDRGLARGDRVALVFGAMDWVDYAIAYFGVLKAGGTAVHFSGALGPDELGRRMTECAPVGMVHGRGLSPLGAPVKWREDVSAFDGADATPVDVVLDPGDLADILYTSGTTGPAKAFTNPHGTLTFGRGPAGLAELDISAPLLAPMPMGTPSSATTVGMLPLNSPSTVVVCQPGETEPIAQLIARYRVATVLLTPWIGIQMVAARVHERHDLSSVTTLAVASAPLPPAVARSLLAMMPAAVISVAFSQGEAVPAVMLSVYDPTRPTSVGRPAPGTELRVAGKAGESVSDGEIGEIWLRSAAPKRRYLDPARNQAVPDDGWTRTRDLGYISVDGDLRLFDRLVDVIETDGRLVSSIEVEAAIYDHPGVREAAVVGVPGRRGRLAVAAVVVPNGVEDRLDGAALRAFLGERLAAYQVPETVHLVDALPRGVTGKVLKHDLRRRLSGLT